MHVEVERQGILRLRQEAEVREPRFLARLAQRDLARVALPIGVAAELEPAVQLAVVGQQHPAVIRGEDPGRPRDVSLGAAAQEAVRVRAHEGAHPLHHRPVLGTAREMALEEPEQEPPVHGPESGKAPRA